MKAYLDLMKRIINEGTWVKNPRTNVNCLTVLNHQIQFDGSELPLLTTRKMNWKGAINEMVAYIRGYVTLKDFHSLGLHTWDENAKNWKDDVLNPNRDLVGLIYGASAERVGISYKDILEMLKTNPYDRGIIWNFWNPEYFKYGCLRPCMYSHQFNVLDGVLYLSSTMRSSDVPLGLAFNLVQAWFLLNVTARLTGLKVGTVTMNLVNCHIYENQLELAKEHIQREPTDLRPKIFGLNRITLEDLFVGIPTDKLSLIDYRPLPAIKYPFTV